MARRHLDYNVFEAAVARMVPLYRKGHRVIVSFSSGKDSTVCLEVCRIAAELTNRLPVEVMMRDEEILFPGSFEYAERVMRRPDVVFHWLVAHQPIVNVANRANPYYWVFDPELKPEQWMRPMPPWAVEIPNKNILDLVTVARFPPPPGKKLYNVIGLRASESLARNLAIHSQKGYLTAPGKNGDIGARPIYDWGDGDVWKAIADNGWDYNRAYDAFMRMGMKKRDLRIAPVAMIAKSWRQLQMASKIWPRWYDRLSERLPGVRQVAMFGLRALQPLHRPNESWQETFYRECINEAPQWIAQRATLAMKTRLRAHAAHSSEPFPDVHPCHNCGVQPASWKELAIYLYQGDPFSLRNPGLPYVEPEFFRPGSGTWGGKPTW